MRLTRRGWGVLGGALALWGAWWILGLRDIWYVVAFLGALLVISALTAVIVPLVVRHTLSVSVSDPAPTLGDQITVTARARGRGTRGFAVVWSETEAVTPLAEELSIEWVAFRRGSRQLGVSRLKFLDPLGLVSRTISQSALIEVLVLPRLIPGLADLIGENHVQALGDASISTAIGSSGPPGGAIRQYRSGDARRQIHWKQTARQGELLVNIHEDAERHRRSILLVTDRDAYPLDDEFERAVSAAATAAIHSIRDGCEVLLDDGAARHVIETEDEALRLFALAETRRRASDRLVPAQVVVTGRVTYALSRSLDGSQGLLIRSSQIQECDVPEHWRQVIVRGR